MSAGKERQIRVLYALETGYITAFRDGRVVYATGRSAVGKSTDYPRATICTPLDLGSEPDQPKYKNGKVNSLYWVKDNPTIHQIIWLAFNGEYDEKLEIDHCNGCKSDNRLSNLRISTKSENATYNLSRKTGENKQHLVIRNLVCEFPNLNLQYLAKSLGVDVEFLQSIIL